MYLYDVQLRSANGLSRLRFQGFAKAEIVCLACIVPYIEPILIVREVVFHSTNSLLEDLKISMRIAC